ncbi:hypothetical protein PPL_08480 [Heterostelium album PN500]|uniref:FNIP repeat-containing protein n=1 Tax=Heterostelium pallidum (strain ATCC 26659 / Pp 5 / PN500) TaxID=670386 RepID=D3BIB2_HETP5|nr:hypothetical protein PPL_08480 [Heterostelium album PN500]EFA79012.1 hypothetical protein PPL_08480 [Heterostelium album PN500]|eukprot:XP_020431135.1 hypothetical protein PPL_08480 [Heterostelium album PN500]
MAFGSNNNDNSQSNNNNNNNIFSHILLAKIINFINDNIDRIVFTLVCKKWYNERDKYLSFNNHHINIINDRNNKYIHLNSYKSMIIDDINRKTKNKAIFGRDFFRYYYDYVITKDQFDDIERFKRLNIDKLKIGLEQNAENQENIKKIYRLISDLNIPKLKYVQSISELPMNITSLSFCYMFREEVVPGCLPPNLKTLKFGRYFNQPILAGVLPSTLEKLIFNKSFNHPLEPGVLPSSLKILKFKQSTFQQDIKFGTFPSNLEVLEFSGNISTIEDGVLPLRLRILENAPTSWLPQIKTLTNLKTLTVGNASQDFHMDLNCLPASLTRLEFRTRITLINEMPPTIRYLDIEKCDYDFNSVFKDRSMYQLDYLRLKPIDSTTTILDDMKIKELEFNMMIDDGSIAMKNSKDSKEEVDIPFGIETLSVQLTSKFQKSISIPSSVKKLVLSKELDCIGGLQKRYDMSGAGSIQELVIVCDEISFFSQRNSVYIPPIIFAPTTLIHLCDIRNEKIWIRMIHNQYYLVYSQSPIMTAIVHKSQIYKYILYIINVYQK